MAVHPGKLPAFSIVVHKLGQGLMEDLAERALKVGIFDNDDICRMFAVEVVCGRNGAEGYLLILSLACRRGIAARSGRRFFNKNGTRDKGARNDDSERGGL